MESSAVRSQPTYDVFLSHAGEDKHTIAIPLLRWLQQRGVVVFLDEKELQPGDDAPATMDHAMETAHIGVFILSREFAAKKWTMKELQCFQRREVKASRSGDQPPLLIPVFYRLSVSECAARDLFKVYREDGKNVFIEFDFFERMELGETSMIEVRKALVSLSKRTGIRNDERATNENSLAVKARRDLLIGRVGAAVVTAVSKRRRLESKSIHPAESHLVPDRRDELRPSFSRPHIPGAVHLDFDSLDKEESALTTESKLKKTLLGGCEENSGIVGLHGMGGVGKSTILRSVPYDDDIKSYFPDGIYLLNIGITASKEEVVYQIRNVIHASGGQLIAEELQGERNLEAVTLRAKEWFRGKQCLFLLDDVSGRSSPATKLISELADASGLDIRRVVVYTTRDLNLAMQHNAIGVKPRNATGEDSRRMLLSYAEFTTEDIMDQESEELLDDLLLVCGGLPVCLAAVGISVRNLHVDNDGPKGSISQYLKPLGSLSGKLIQRDVGDYTNPFFTYASSIASLEADRVEGRPFPTALSFAEMHRALCIVEKDTAVPVHVLAIVWMLKGVTEALAIARAFANLGLVELEMRVESQVGAWVKVHGLVHSYLCTQAEAHGEEKKVHDRVLRGYMATAGIHQNEVSKFPEWWSAALGSDGYIHRNLSRHLYRAGRERELVFLVGRIEWTARQFEVGGIASLKKDFGFAISALEGTDSGGTVSGFKDILEAARLSASFVGRSSSELWFQMYGRLVGKSGSSPTIRGYLKQIKVREVRPWLRPPKFCLSSPGNVLKGVSLAGVEVSCAAVMKKSRRIVCGSRDGEIVVVDWDDGVVLRWLGHNGSVGDVAVSYDDDILVSTGFDDRLAKVWNPLTGELGVVFNGHKADGRFVVGIPFSVAIATDKKIFTARKTVRKWDAKTGIDELAPIGEDKLSRYSHVAVSNDGKLVIAKKLVSARFGDMAVCSWDAETGLQHREALSSKWASESRSFHIVYEGVSLSGDGNHVAGGFGGIAIVWDVKRGVEKCLLKSPGHLGRVPFRCIAWNGDDSRMIAGGNGGVAVFDVASGSGQAHKAQCTVAGPGTVRTIMGLSDKREVVVCYANGTLHRLDIGKSEKREYWQEWESVQMTCLAIAPDGRHLVSGCQDGAIRVWEVSSGKMVGQALLGHDAGVVEIDITSNGKKVVSVGEDDSLRVWDVGAREQARCFTGRCLSSVSLARNGTRAITGSYDNRVAVWDIDSNNGNVEYLSGHTAKVQHVCSSDEGRQVVTLSDKEAILWDLEEEEMCSKKVVKYTDEVGLLLGESDVDVLAAIGVARRASGSVEAVSVFEQQVILGTRDDHIVLGTLEKEVERWTYSEAHRLVCVLYTTGEVNFLQLEV